MSTNIADDKRDATSPSSVIPGEESATAGLADAVSVRTPEFAEFSPVAGLSGAASLDNLLDVAVTVTAELGRSTTSIGELLKLSVGSVVELDRLISEPVELMAQGVRLARGEVVVVEDRFAIRIKEIVEPKKRV